MLVEQEQWWTMVQTKVENKSGKMIGNIQKIK